MDGEKGNQLINGERVDAEGLPLRVPPTVGASGRVPKPFEPENRGTLIGHASSTRAYEFMTPAKLIELALVELSEAFEDATEANVRHLLVGGEPGVALEILCTQLLEYDISVSRGLKQRLVAAAQLMKMEVDDLGRLRTTC